MLKQIYRFLNPKYQNLFLEYKVKFQPRYGHGKPPHKELYRIINHHRSTYQSLLKETLELKKFIWEIKNQKDEQKASLPTWNNGFLPGLDIIGLYSIFNRYSPNKYIEIGSGNSTKVAKKAIKDLDLQTHITSIDPQPRAEIDALADVVIRKPFEDIDLEIIDSLEENDVIFVDNSHRILPNSDATVFFMEILPRLKKGVIVHIHDIYLPYDYPQFMCDRFYSEQYGLAFYLMAAPTKFVPIMPNFFISEDKELAGILAPIWDHANLKSVERHGGSFWLKIE